MSSSNPKKKSDPSDEVEQLLQAAQDEMLLKLSVDSHMSRVSPDDLDPDLDHRFQALKSRPSVTRSSSKPRRHRNVPSADEVKGVPGDDDLSARFAALKASLHVSVSASSSSLSFKNDNERRVNSDRSEFLDRDDDEDDEVEVIQWAKDAARLDPFPPSDDELLDVDYSDSDSNSDEVDRKKGRRK